MQFADLHDTPGRMQARGAIRKIVPWASSRSFFYWRLKRRLAEFELRKQARRPGPLICTEITWHDLMFGGPVSRQGCFCDYMKFMMKLLLAPWRFGDSLDVDNHGLPHILPPRLIGTDGTRVIFFPVPWTLPNANYNIQLLHCPSPLPIC